MTLLYIYITINIAVMLCAFFMLHDKPLSRLEMSAVIFVALLFGTFVLLNRLFLYLEGEE